MSKKKKNKTKALKSSEVQVVKKTKTILKRKQDRKDKRQAKKNAKREFVKKKFKGNLPRSQKDDEEIPSSDDESGVKIQKPVKQQVKAQDKKPSDHDKIKKDMKELKRQQQKQRKKQLVLANEAEEKNIKFLEKNLGMKRRKSKNLPKSFLDDGLDYLLDACDSKKIAAFENENLDEDEEDFDKELDALMESEDEDDENDDLPDEDDEMFSNEENEDSEDNTNFEEEMISEVEETEAGEDSDSDENQDPLEEDEDEVNEEDLKDEVWEDIYGRKRDTKGNVIEAATTAPTETGSKYIPPALRLKAAGLGDSEQKRIALERLAKQIKGLLNRLAESNMIGICRDIERFYSTNSRNDVNNTLAELLLSSLVHETAIIPARLIMEHCMMVAVLHANVGTEVGAYILQQLVLKFESEFQQDLCEEQNTLNNLLVIICYLYAWKIVQCSLIFDILNMLTERFLSKDIQLIIVALTNCGMCLRKDDPVALKAFILKVQSVASKSKSEDSRVQFMIEVLTGIKNNNVNKIPNYDPSHFEHLKKNFKSCIRDGKFVTELNISYKDLVQAESKGRWWIVGSAFTGNLVGTTREDDQTVAEAKQGTGEQFSDKLLELARKMRMNTDIRRTVFCLIMSAEDYMDCAEKLVKLGTKNQTEREVVFVVTDCCLQEKDYNPYYGHVAAKLSRLDRKYRVAMQFHIWDRVKQLGDIKKTQLANLALLAKFLIVEKVQSLGLLKVIEFADLDKANLRLLKLIIVGILQDLGSDKIFELFKAVSEDSKLKMFRESLKLFMNHFLMKQSKNGEIESLRPKIKIAEKALMSASSSSFKL